MFSGCTAQDATAIRLNDDGTIDFVYCEGLAGVTEVNAATTMRTGPNGTIDYSTETQLEPDREITDYVTGTVITFSGAPDEWDRLDISLATSDDLVLHIAERDRVTVGEWHWPEVGFGIAGGAGCDFYDPRA